jgi:hypothetical protein
MAAGDGLVTMTPTSITHAGTSASINADGGVDFTAVTSLSLNGVFTSSNDNYLLVISHSGNTSGAVSIRARMRASGTDATGTNYTVQNVEAGGSTVSGARDTSQTSAKIGATNDTLRSGDTVHIYGPYLAQATATRSVNVSGNANAYLLDFASTHSLSTSYDGITIFPNSGTLTGNIVVFGYEE